MDPITLIVSSLVAGAAAKAKDVASQAISDAYNGLKGLIVRKLGNGGALQSVEDDPNSSSARAVLVEALAKKEIPLDAELSDSIGRLERAIEEVKQSTAPGAFDIDIEGVRGQVNATVENLIAAGRIKLGPVVATTGDAKVSGLRAGVPASKTVADSKKN